MLISAACLQGDFRLALAHHEEAQEHLSGALHPPSRYAISALLVMAVLVRSASTNADHALTYVTLAIRLCSAVRRVPTGVQLTAAMLSYALRRQRDVVWPPLQAPIGV